MLRTRPSHPSSTWRQAMMSSRTCLRYLALASARDLFWRCSLPLLAWAQVCHYDGVLEEGNSTILHVAAAKNFSKSFQKAWTWSAFSGCGPIARLFLHQHACLSIADHATGQLGLLVNLSCRWRSQGGCAILKLVSPLNPLSLHVTVGDPLSFPQTEED